MTDNNDDCSKASDILTMYILMSLV